MTVDMKTVISRTQCEGASGTVGDEIASAVLANLDAAGYVVQAKPVPVAAPTEPEPAPFEAEQRTAPRHVAKKK